MAKLIDILQTKHELDVPNGLIKKLYDMITEKENHNGDGVFNDNSKFDGEITLSNPTYKEYTDKINEVFPYLIIHTSYYLLFQDKKVETMMINHLLSKGVGDGIGITEENAKDILITSLPSFRSNTSIEYFNELPKFEKIKSISGWAFVDCTSLKEIDLSNINSIGEALFNGCTSLEKVTLGSLVSLPNAIFVNCPNLKTVTGTSNITSIGGYCFQDCARLENIDLSNVTTINGPNTFRGCKSFTSINLENCTSIGNGAFDNCSNLESVENTTNLITIGNSVFNGTAITSIDLENCTSIGNMAFYKCNNLKSVENTTNLITIGENAFRETAITGIDLENCTSIGSFAFYICKSLTSLNLPSCQTINADAFNGCSALAINVNLPNLTSLGSGVFRSSGILSIVNIGNVTQIGGATFQECKSLTTINNNALYNVTSLGAGVFKSCSALTDIGEIANLEYIGAECFSGCSLLTTCIDFSHVKTIGVNSLTNNNISAKRNSKGCIDMTSIERIESFIWGNNAPTSFTGYIDLGTHLTYINTQNYSQLNASLIIRNTVLPTLDSSGYSHLNVKDGYYVYVLDEKLDDWKTLCSGYPGKFKPISELPVELQ